MMEADLIGLLLGDTGVTALVGARVTPVSRTQGSALPAITVQRVSGSPLYADDGETGLQQARVQIDCWGETYGSGKDLARVVISALSALRDVIQGGTTFIYIMLEAERDLRETGADAAEYLDRTSLDFVIWTNT